MTYTIKNKNIQISEAELAELIQQKENKSRGVPSNGNDFWHLSLYGDIEYSIWDSSKSVLKLLESGNVFLTEEAAQLEANKRKARASILRFIREKGLEFQPNWNDLSQSKSVISIYKNQLRVESVVSTNYGMPFYFKFEDDARLVIEAKEPELRTLFS